jgi:hypothetical protein
MSSALPPLTLRRLQKLPQLPSVWEGDRCAMQDSLPNVRVRDHDEQQGDCVLWVDGSTPAVRAMDVVPTAAGPEAVVRTLLRAMEQPHSPAQPARPRKIVVRDRQLQFFLRGVLKDLDITVNYAPHLPCIDEIFASFQEAAPTDSEDTIPEHYEDLLITQAEQIWKDGIWSSLAEHQVIAIHLNRWDIDTFYLSVMGLMGMEFGLLLYRSLDALQAFRQVAIEMDSSRDLDLMEEAFLRQDCIFMTFQSLYEDDDEAIALGLQPGLSAADDFEDVDFELGSLHPLEGIRPNLHEEELAALTVALEALHRFWQRHGKHLSLENFPAKQSKFRIPDPTQPEGVATVQVKVETLPEVADALDELITEGDALDDADADALDSAVALASVPLGGPGLPGAPQPGIRMVPLEDDFVPDGAFLSLGMLPWEVVDVMERKGRFHSSVKKQAARKPKGRGMPIFMIQTTRPKVKAMMAQLEACQNPVGMGFQILQQMQSGNGVRLGILRTGNGQHLIIQVAEYDDPQGREAYMKWRQRCQETDQRCGLLLADGATGRNCGNPQQNNLVLLYEMPALDERALSKALNQLTRL